MSFPVLLHQLHAASQKTVDCNDSVIHNNFMKIRTFFFNGSQFEYDSFILKHLKRFQFTILEIKYVHEYQIIISFSPVHIRNFIDVTVYLISVPATMVFYVSVLESYYMSLK